MTNELSRDCMAWIDSLGGKPFFKSEADAERFRTTFGLELKIALNTHSTGDRGLGAGQPGRYTPSIVADLEIIREIYPDYKLPEKSVEELKPFLVGPYAHVLAI